MTTSVLTTNLSGLVRDVPDFPTPGILFKDITPVLANPGAVREITNQFSDFARKLDADVIVGIESRGFVFGMPLALELGVPFVPVRKKGKLPAQTICEEYALEYGTSALEIHADAVESNQRVLIVDDLLATGGTALATRRLVERLGALPVGFCFVIELEFLNGREALAHEQVLSLLKVPD